MGSIFVESLKMSGDLPKRRNETAEQRKKRLAAELRANLVKRKAKARALSRGEIAEGLDQGGRDPD